MRTSRGLVHALCFFFAVGAASASALAQDAPPPPPVDNEALGQIQDVARVKAEEGLALYAEGRYAEAYERLRVAEDLFHAPTLLLYMAHCQREVGKLLAARDLYQRVANEVVPDDAPDAFREAPATARAHLEELAPQIPKLELVVVGIAPELAYVTLDGKPARLSPETIEVDPGDHRIDASATGAQTVVMQVNAERSTAQRVEIELEPRAEPPPPPPPPGPSGRPAQPGSLVPAFVAFGVGAAGLAVGGITGAMVLSEVDRIREGCDGDTCPSSLEADRDDARPLATVSTVGFIVGGVGAAAGVVLLVWRPGGESATTGGGPPAPASSSLRAVVGPSSLSLTGSF